MYSSCTPLCYASTKPCTAWNHRRQDVAPEQDPAGEQEPEEGEVIGELRQDIGDPVLDRHVLTRDPEVEVDPEQDHDHQCETRPDHDLRLAVLFLQLPVRGQHDQRMGLQGGRRRDGRGR